MVLLLFLWRFVYLRLTSESQISQVVCGFIGLDFFDYMDYGGLGVPITSA